MKSNHILTHPTNKFRGVGRCQQLVMEGNILFNDAINTFYLRSYGVGHMLRTIQIASYLEVKTIIKNCFNTSWKKRMNVEKEKDYLETLDRTQQVIIFRVRTGHCRLLSHLYRLRLAHTDECPCGTDSQTPEHILQSCPSHNTLRQETWPYPVDLNEKLWGPTASLRRTADFLVRTGLDI